MSLIITVVCLGAFYRKESKVFLVNALESDLLYLTLELLKVPFLFLIYFSILNVAKIHHFADDTNMFHVNNSISDLNKCVRL